MLLLFTNDPLVMVSLGILKHFCIARLECQKHIRCFLESIQLLPHLVYFTYQEHKTKNNLYITNVYLYVCTYLNLGCFKMLKIYLQNFYIDSTQCKLFQFLSIALYFLFNNSNTNKPTFSSLGTFPSQNYFKSQPSPFLIELKNNGLCWVPQRIIKLKTIHFKMILN